MNNIKNNFLLSLIFFYFGFNWLSNKTVVEYSYSYTTNYDEINKKEKIEKKEKELMDQVNVFSDNIKKINDMSRDQFIELYIKRDYFDSIKPTPYESFYNNQPLICNSEVIKNYVTLINEQLFLITDDFKFTTIINSFEESIWILNKSKNPMPLFISYMNESEYEKYKKKINAGSLGYKYEKTKNSLSNLSVYLASFSLLTVGVLFFKDFFVNISNNMLQPFFNRWGKHREFYAKLQFENISDFGFKDLVGYENVKKKFKNVVNELDGQKNKKSKLEGICLYGKPGNGKTQFVRALAAEAKVPLLIVNLNLLLNSSGKIEENISLLFKLLRQKAPCIVFFDEFDLIVGSRFNGKLLEGEKLILNQMLQELDGMFVLDGVLVVASTNIIENVDEALLRPGRLGRVIEIGSPNESDVKAFVIDYFNKNAILSNNDINDYIVKKIISLEKMNMAIVKSLLIKIVEHMKKNKIKAINQNNYLTIIDEVFL